MAQFNSDLKKLIVKLKSFKDNIRTIALEELDKNSGLILQLNKEQLELGLNGDGEPIGFYRSGAYAAFKQRIGSKSPRGQVDLKVTGGFYKSRKTISIPGGKEIIATDKKTTQLLEKYGKQVLELTEDNKQRLALSLLLGIKGRFRKEIKNANL